MFRGLATVNFFAADMRAAEAWYTELFGIPPYFRTEVHGVTGYIEFRLGDHEAELGIIAADYAPYDTTKGPGGAVTYWHVDDLEATFDRLKSLGATVLEDITPRGDSGFVTASVVDPFGNVLAIMTNPHYLSVLAAAAMTRLSRSGDPSTC
jgi:predicted enzyme related to lactoylglutathione lyase